MRHEVTSWIIKIEEVREKHSKKSRNNPTPVSTQKIPDYIAVYQNRYELYFRGRIVLDDDAYKVI